jgi:dienelactone hydrolase
MGKRKIIYLAIAVFLSCTWLTTRSQDSLTIKPDTIVFKSGDLSLKGLLWKPEGKGPFPAVLFNHGSELNSLKYLPVVGYYFVQHGYAFFVPFRRGQSLSAGQGKYIGEVLDSILKTQGPEARFAAAIPLHEKEQLQDQISGLLALKKIKGIDSTKIAVAGVSFGGIQTMLMACQKYGVKAAVNFAGAAMMWKESETVREWMKKLAANTTIPVFFVQAENDFSTEPSIQGAAAMENAGKTYKIKIYPPNGTRQIDGHLFVRKGKIWGEEVFEFLDKYVLGK